MSEAQDSLAESLSQSIPEGLRFGQYHISTPPTQCRPLCPPPPNGNPEKTYCESHSLLITIPAVAPLNSDGQVAVFAIELQIYTTARLTTVFVSKADSTGFLSILDLPRQSGSVLQALTSAFISWVIRRRHRPDRRLVLTLFARAQNQYLFPGSVDNGRKHVLDDRALVKWWCKTLDPVLRRYDPESEEHNDDQTVRTKAHLIVPGHDAYETQSFFPQSYRSDPPTQRRWANSHPLRQIATNPAAPPRYLVPHFPDDPKARFLHDLDEELADAPQSNQSVSSKHESPSKRGKGQWKSVRTLEEFWEMMAFRQECSSGRLVGFLWIVFTPDSMLHSNANEGREQSPSPSRPSLKRKIQDRANDSAPTMTLTPKRQKHLRPLANKLRKSKKRLTGPIRPRSPRVKSSGVARANSTSRHDHDTPTTTKYYHSPLEARGALVLSQRAYDRVHELLLRLDFSNLDMAKASTKRWIAESGVTASAIDGAEHWGKPVIGRKKMEHQGIAKQQAEQMNGVTMLTAKKKRSGAQDETSNGNVGMTGDAVSAGSSSATITAPVENANMLGGSLVRKKPKAETPASAPPGPDPSQGREVNTLGAGLVRKKAKT